MGKNDLQVLIIGYGIQGKKRKHNSKNVFAVVDPISNEADFKNIKEVPEDKYDAAFICTNDAEKYNLINFLIEKKKHILVEKPLSFESKDVYKNFEKSLKKNNLVLYTAYNHRFEPHFIKMKELIKSKKLGKIYNLRIFYGNGTSQLVKNSSWRDTDPGVLSDLGSHVFDALDFWIEDIKTFSFQPTCAANYETKSFDYAFIHSSNPEKPFIQIELSMLSWRNSFTCDIYGELGSAHINSLCKWGPSTFTYRKRVFPSGRPSEENQILIKDDPTWELEFNHFIDICLKSKKPNLNKDIWINEMIKNLNKKIIF